MKVLAAASLLNMLGFSFVWPLTSIFITQELGRSPSFAGFVLTGEAIAGIIGSFLGGAMYDRWGARRIQTISAVLAASTVFTLAVSQQLAVFVGMLILLNFFIGVIITGINALAASLWPGGGRKAFDLIYLANNIGVAAGSSLGGLAAEFSLSYVFAINGLTFLLFSLLIGLAAGKQEAPIAVRKNVASSDIRNKETLLTGGDHHPRFFSLLSLCAGMVFCLISYIQWQSTISIYMKSLGYSLSSYSLLWTINGIMIICIQPFAAQITKKLLPSLSKQLICGVVLYIASFLVLSLHQEYAAFIIAMALMTAGEILVWPAIPAAASALAPEGKKGFYQGLINTSGYTGRMLGPMLGGFMYDHYGPQAMLLTMTLFFLLALASFACTVKYQSYIWRENDVRIGDSRLLEREPHARV